MFTTLTVLFIVIQANTILDTIERAAKLVKEYPILLGVFIGCFVMWLVAMWITAMVNAMDSPGPDSTPRYRYWFKVLHFFVGMTTRARIVIHDPAVKPDPEKEKSDAASA